MFLCDFACIIYCLLFFFVLINRQHDAFYNVQQLLAENILSSDYFKSLYRYKRYHEVIDEIVKHCKSLEPRITGLLRKPSTAFCILYKFFTMVLTVKQVKGLIDNSESPFARGIGFLYLRYLLPPKEMWKWFEPYFDDSEEFSPGNDGKLITIGHFVKQLIDNHKYYSTLLPRIPVKIQRAYKKKVCISLFYVFWLSWW